MSGTRREDLIAAFVQTIDIAIEKDVDAVVHTGDLTDGDQLEENLPEDVLRALARLKAANIPFLFIVGNHDQSRTGRAQWWASDLEAKNLGTRLSTESTDVGGVAFYGIDYHETDWWRNATPDFEPAIGNPPTILCLHQTVGPFLGESKTDLELDSFLSESFVDFDAVLLGHLHRSQEATVSGAVATYAGATERISHSEREYAPSVSLVTVDEEGAVETSTVELETRTFETYTVVRGAGYDRDQLASELDGHIEEHSVLTVSVTGEDSELDLDVVRDTFEAYAPVDIRVDTDDVDSDLNPGVYRGAPDHVSTQDRIGFAPSLPGREEVAPTDVLKNTPVKTPDDSEQYLEYLEGLPNRGDQCNFVFDPSHWGDHFSEEINSEKWSCPRSSDGECCLFHTPVSQQSAASQDVRSAFLKDVTKNGHSTFIGARLGSLDLSHATIEATDHSPIDLSHARISGRLALTSATIRTPLRLRSAVIGALSAEKGTFKRTLDASDVSVAGEGLFDDTEFERLAVFEGMHIEDVSFERTVFRRGAYFESCRVEREACFEQGRFEGAAEFSDAVFAEGFTAEDARFEQQAEFHEVIFGDGCEFSGVKFNRKTNFRRATFAGRSSFFAVQADNFLGFHDADFLDRASFFSASFDSDVYFRETTFHEGASFERLTTGKKGIQFQGATSEGNLNFSQSSFGGRVFFDGDGRRPPAKIDGNLEFGQATFHDDAFFAGIHVEWQASFEQVTWKGSVTFGIDAATDEDTREKTFGGGLVLDRGTFQSDLDLHGIACKGILSGNSIRVEGELDLKHASLDKGATFTESTFRTVVFDSLECRNTPRVDLSGAEIQSGSIHQQGENIPLYDLSDARVGDMSISGTSDTAPVFETLFIKNTRFDGFEFLRAREQIPDSWELHRIDDRFDTVEIPGLSAKQKESVYRNAKNGASAVSDSVAAANFFQHEMRHKRDSYRESLPSNPARLDRTKNAGMRLQNFLMQKTMGYGEQTYKVILTGGALSVVGFPVVYMATETLFSGTFPTSYQSYFDYATLSLGVFSGFSSGISVAWPFVYLVHFESFLGTLFLAMLVLTLTRSVYR